MDIKTSYILFWLFQVAVGVVITAKGDFLTNCFTDDDGGQCEYSRVKICGDYYACDMAIPFQSPIKRIGYIDDHILVAEGTKTHVINEDTHEAKLIKKVIPPWGEFIDKKGNKYYTGDGTTYVGVNETGKEIEIVTTGEYSSNQLVLDEKANRLFILTFMAGERKDLRAGYLFAVTLEPLNIVDDKIQAEKVEGDDSITAMAVQGGLQKLLLGTRTEKGGKLIRLNRLKVDPCSTNDIHKSAINDVVQEASAKLVKIFEESDFIAKKNCDADRNKLNALKTTALEIEQLKSELNLTSTKLNACVFRVFSMNITEKSSAFGVQYGETTTRERISCSNKKQKSKREADYDDEQEHVKHKCIPIDQYECMKNKIKQLEKTETELRVELLQYSQEISAFSTDPLLEERFSSFKDIKVKTD